MVERRKTPRRRVRDQLATPGGKPALDDRPTLVNQRLLVDDELREAALALAEVEAFLTGIQEELLRPAPSAERLRALGSDQTVELRLANLDDNLARLRRRLVEVADAVEPRQPGARRG